MILNLIMIALAITVFFTCADKFSHFCNPVDSSDRAIFRLKFVAYLVIIIYGFFFYHWK